MAVAIAHLSEADGAASFALSEGLALEAGSVTTVSVAAGSGGELTQSELSILFSALGATVGVAVAITLLAFGVILIFLKTRQWLHEKSHRRESQLSELTSTYSVGSYFYDYRDLEEDSTVDIESIKNDTFLRSLEEGI